jgi:hypothetical protein
VHAQIPGSSRRPAAVPTTQEEATPRVGLAAGKSKPKPADDDERPPICPACGVTMGIVVGADGTTRYVCLECGFADDSHAR